MNISLPDFVIKTIKTIEEEESPISIWLIGSRANNSWNESSDWDLLVFSKEPLRSRAKRHDKIDVINVDSDRNCLLEGMDIDCFVFSFDCLDWVDRGDNTATYTGKSSHHASGMARDTTVPFYDSNVSLKAYCVLSQK